MTVTKGAERADGERTRYFSCTGKSHNRACKGVKNPLYADTLEDMVYELIAEKLADLKQRRRTISTDNTQKINMLKNELQSIKNEQNNLVKAITSGTANNDTMTLINASASELANKQKRINEQIALLEEADSEMVNIVEFSKKWKTAKFNERKAVCNVLIDKIYMHEDGAAEVVWNI